MSHDPNVDEQKDTFILSAHSKEFKPRIPSNDKIHNNYINVQHQPQYQNNFRLQSKIEQIVCEILF